MGRLTTLFEPSKYRSVLKRVASGPGASSSTALPATQSGNAQSGAGKVPNLKRQQAQWEKLLANSGQFADGTLLTPKSLKAWKKKPVAVKAKSNLENLDKRIVSWDVLTTFSDQKAKPRRNRSKQTNRSKSGTFTRSPHVSGTKSMVFFLHIPKTGGTTLEYLFAKNYVISHVLHINSPELHRKPYLMFKHGSLPQVVMGHHDLSSIVYQLFNRPLIHITLLREPVSRIISYYDYLYTSEGHKLHPKVKKLGLKEFVKSNDFAELQNAQTLRLFGQLKRRNLKNLLWQRTIDLDEALNEAKKTLRDRMSIVGVTEDYGRFLLMLKLLLGWSDIYYQRRNTSKQKTNHSTVDPEIIEIIRERNQCDIVLYNYAKQLFDERCDQLGITQADVEQFKSLNKRYQDLLANSM